MATTTRNRLHGMSGEELLMLRVFGGDGVRPTVDRELDRRAFARPARIEPAAYAPHRAMRRLVRAVA